MLAVTTSNHTLADHPLERGLEAEDPAELELIGSRANRQFGTADIQRQVEPGGEAGVTDSVIGSKADSRVAQKPEAVPGKGLVGAAERTG